MPEVFSQKKAHTPKHIADLKPEELAIPEGNSYSPLASYCYYPKHVHFIGVDDHERIILLLRKHWITNMPWVVTGILLALAPIPFVYFPILVSIPERFLVVTVLFWYLATSAYMLEKFISWFFNVYIVTDERVFDVDFYNLVDRDITDANIEDIQDVTSSIRGAIRTALDYGDIFIQTAAEIPEIDFNAVPHPDKVAKILRELRVEEQQEKIEGRVR